MMGGNHYFPAHGISVYMTNTPLPLSANHVDRTNKTYGNFLAIRYLGHIKPNSRKTWWECRCKCGKVVTKRSDNLDRYLSSTCGCERTAKYRRGNNHYNWSGFGSIPGSLWCRIKRSGSRKGLEFTITIQDVDATFQKQQGKCALSGVTLLISSQESKTTASLDRIDSSRGYTPDNVQWVHKTVNRMKTDLVEEDFLKWCSTISDHQQHDSAVAQRLVA